MQGGCLQCWLTCCELRGHVRAALTPRCGPGPAKPCAQGALWLDAALILATSVLSLALLADAFARENAYQLLASLATGCLLGGSQLAVLLVRAPAARPLSLHDGTQQQADAPWCRMAAPVASAVQVAVQSRVGRISQPPQHHGQALCPHQLLHAPCHRPPARAAAALPQRRARPAWRCRSARRRWPAPHIAALAGACTGAVPALPELEPHMLTLIGWGNKVCMQAGCAPASNHTRLRAHPPPCSRIAANWRLRPSQQQQQRTRQLSKQLFAALAKLDALLLALLLVVASIGAANPGAVTAAGGVQHVGLLVGAAAAAAALLPAWLAACAAVASAWIVTADRRRRLAAAVDLLYPLCYVPPLLVIFAGGLCEWQQPSRLHSCQPGQAGGPAMPMPRAEPAASRPGFMVGEPVMGTPQDVTNYHCHFPCCLQVPAREHSWHSPTQRPTLCFTPSSSWRPGPPPAGPPAAC